jgi:hypothetical protein
MSVTLKCPDCGHTVQADDETPRTCPKCDGTMKKPGYKAKTGPAEPPPKAKPAAKPAAPPAAKPAAKSTPAPAAEKNPFDFGSDDEAEEAPPPKKAAPKAKTARDDDDEDEPQPRRAAAKPVAKPAKKKDEPLSLDEDEDDDKGAGDFRRDGKAAESLDIDSGFNNKKLMKQVAEELSRKEVLHWAGRMCPEIAEKSAKKAMLFGILFAAFGGIFVAVGFAAAPWWVGLILLLFPTIGIALAVLGPKVIRKQAALGWYAVTDQRAIVYSPSPFGSGGKAQSYEPAQLRRMRVQKSKIVDGAGDLIFKTTITERRTDYVDRKTGQTVRSETSRSEQHEGFLGIENVREVETLVHNVLLGGRDDDEGDDDREDEEEDRSGKRGKSDRRSRRADDDDDE